MYPSPGIVLLFSGKRKSGKDYITNQLYKMYVNITILFI